MASAKLGELRTDGVRVAIDDFGAGYSSLSYLARLPIDMIKIDRSFIQLLGSTIEDGQLALAICKIAKTLGFDVIGEGIESIGQIHHLQQMGCDYGQGFELGRPVPPEEFEALLCADTDSATA
jgi:EAL domain-containing protein (putative c-di-GMP-specific phosphodiesterase class I)